MIKLQNISDYYASARKRKAKRAVKRKGLGTERGYKALMAEAWTICSLWVRARHKKEYGPLCPFNNCTKPIQDAFHFKSRTFLNIKFDPDNLCGSCKGHNWHEQNTRGRTNIYSDWFIANRGLERWERLERLAEEYKRGGVKLERYDLIKIIAFYRGKLARGDYD